MLTLTALVPIVLSSGTAASAAQSAAHTDDFVDRIGVNVHLHYSDTVYSRYGDLVKPRLLERGVRHIRDGAYTYDAASADTFYYRRLRDLGRHGVRANLLTAIDTRGSERTNVSKLADVQAWTGNSVISFEGMNEPDLVGGYDWVRRTIGLQQDVWNEVQAEPALANVDVVAPSVVFDTSAVGNISAWAGFSNWHSYPGGNCPTCGDVYGNSFDSAVNRYRAPAGGKPLVVTETGYHNATVGEQEHRPVSELAAGKYIPRLLFEYFNRGVARTYIYELIDLRPDSSLTQRDLHFGLLRNDGSRKPAFIAVRNLITLLDDPGPAFSPASLSYAIGGDTAHVHQSLLQKRDGRFYLALWQERRSYDNGQRANRSDDVGARRDLTVAPQQITVMLDNDVSTARLFQPSTSTTPIRSWSQTNKLTLAVPDEIMLLELTTDHGADEADRAPPSSSVPEDNSSAEEPSDQTHDPRPPPIQPPADTSVCGDVPRTMFGDVPPKHPFAREINCLAAQRITQGTGTGKMFEPARRVPRWQMAVFVDRLINPTVSDIATSHATAGFNDLEPLAPETQEAIRRLHAAGLVKGTSLGSFSPHQHVRRGQVAAFINRTAAREGIARPATTDRFADDDGTTHENDINALTAIGIIRGSNNGRVRPHAPISRGAMAAVLTRFADHRAAGSSRRDR